MSEPARSEESERRQATIMFADISGFTAMSESLDAEEVTNVLNDCFVLLGQIVDENGGHIDKFIGDCVMAVFGVPIALENAPERALAAALSMRTAMGRFNEKRDLPHPLEMHIGINSGEVISGRVGTAQKSEHTVMGDSVNVASRLEDASLTGQILVGEGTYRVSRNQFTFRSLDPVTLKGKKDPVPVYELVGKRTADAEGDEPAARLISSEFIGRQSETDGIKLQVLKLINRQGSIVSVIGDAGIGKSRLIAEISVEEKERLCFVEGRGDSIGQQIPFFPIRGAFRRWARIEVDDGTEEIVRKLRRLVAQFLPGEEASIVPYLANLFGFKSDGALPAIEETEGEALLSEMVDVVKRVLVAASQDLPLVCIFDDLQWFDESSIEFLESMLRLAEDHPILFVVLFRPTNDETGGRIQRTASERHSKLYFEFRLSPLSRDKTEVLIKSLLNVEGLPYGTREQIIERSGGNPYFVEEVVQAMLDSQGQNLRDQFFRFESDAKPLEIPKTIDGVIMSRIDQLEEDIRQILRVASVVGRSFRRSVIARVAVGSEELNDKFEYLQRMRIIGAQLRSGETEYFFEHAVAQEVIYRSILVQSRKAIHSAVGHAIEDLYRDRIEEFYPTLAYHYSQSGELELAEQYLIEAGNAALESSASSEALNLFHEALQSYISRAPGTLDQEKIAMLNERIARAYRYKGYHAAATDHFAQALTSLGENVSEVHRVKRSIYLLMSLLRISSYYLYGYKRAKRIPSSDEIRRIHLLYWMLTSAAMSKSYRLDRCVRLLTKNLSDVGYKQVPVAARLYLSARSSMTLDGWSGFFTRFISRRMERFVIADDPIVKLTHEFDRVIYFSAIGEWDVPCRMALVDTNLKRGEMQMPNCYLYWHGLLCIEKGDADQIQKLLAESDRIRSFYDNDEAQLTSCMIRTRYHIKSREYESAIHQGRVALAISEKIGLGVLQFWTLGQIAQAQISLDRDEEASSLLDQMRRWIKEAKPFPFALITYHIARLKQRIRAIESGDGSRTRRASSSGETAFHTVSRIHSLSNKWKVEQTESLKLMGTYHWLSGRRAKAMRWWSRAIDVGGKLGAELEVARTRLEMGLRIGNHSPDGSSHRRALAIESLRGAADYFERAGLSADLYEARGIIRRIGG